MVDFLLHASEKPVGFRITLQIIDCINNLYFQREKGTSFQISR